jgi:hypothetical protein
MPPEFENSPLAIDFDLPAALIGKKLIDSLLESSDIVLL